MCSDILRSIFCSFLMLLVFLFTLLFYSNGHAETKKDIYELSLEELLNIEVTSVSKKPERLADAATAIFVITQEDIKRSGATCIPEALRMVPGLNVGRIDSSKWTVTTRGFNVRFANKLLVLIDGRSVYIP